MDYELPRGRPRKPLTDEMRRAMALVHSRAFNISQAAKAMGVSRMMLSIRLKEEREAQAKGGA